MNSDLIKRDWPSRGYRFGVFLDPPGQVWADFVHRTDELLMLAEGENPFLLRYASLATRAGQW